MAAEFFRWAIFAVFCAAVTAEVAFRWDKTRILPQMGLNNWRATSFAMTKDKVFLSLIDIGKEFSGNGVVGAFNMSTSKSPDVSVFPFQNFYKINDPERGKVTTPMSLRTDQCDRLWLLDSAVQNISGSQMKTNPGVYIFNTKNSQLVRNFNFPMSQWTATTFFVNFVLETDSVAHDCEESFGYFADFNRFHLLTYDFLRNKSELKTHPFFSPDPLVHTPETFLFNADQQDRNGIFGLALAEHSPPNEMDALYFHPLAGTHEFRINTQVLKTEGNVNYQDVQIFKDKGENSGAGASVYDPESDTIFFAEVNTRMVGGVQLNDPSLSTYCRYDLKLQSGVIADLTVRHSHLWALVDDDTQVTIHKLPIVDLKDQFLCRQEQPPKPQTPSSASQTLPLVLLPLAVLLSLVGFL